MHSLPSNRAAISAVRPKIQESYLEGGVQGGRDEEVARGMESQVCDWGRMGSVALQHLVRPDVPNANSTV